MLNLTKTAASLFAGTALIALGTSAVQAAEFEDYARVINVRPQVEQVNTPRQECRVEQEFVSRTRSRQYQQYPQQSERTNGGAVVGGIAGGLLGSQVGGGNGRIAAAALGALAGAIVGDRVENNGNNNIQNNNQNYNQNYNNGYYDDQQGNYERRPVRQCRMVEGWETRTNGYAVTYEYQNRTYTSVLPYDPGNRLRLMVSLTPRL